MSSVVDPRTLLFARFGGAALALAVAGIHIIDQGGFPGSKTPEYVGFGYYLLEGASVITAAALLLPLRSRLSDAAWTVAAVVAAGPLLGYVLSRGPGLPDYDDDIGNWTEPLGVASLIVESTLLVLAVTVVIANRRARSRNFARPAGSRLDSTDIYPARRVWA